MVKRAEQWEGHPPKRGCEKNASIKRGKRTRMKKGVEYEI